MTKQQQEAYDKFLKALELQEQGIPRQEIYKIVGYASLDSLTKYMRKQGYRFSEQAQKYVKLEGNTNSSTKSSTSIEIVNNSHLTTYNKHIDFIELLSNEKDTLIDMLAWYRKNTSKSNKGLIMIELPESDNTMISTRSNREVWEQFKAFAKKNNSFTMGDLVAQALLDYMKNHDL